MIVRINRLFQYILAYSIVLGILSCQVQLAPAHSENIVEGLSEASSDVLKLMAAESQGLKKADYEKFRDDYNGAIGQLESLQIQMESRPVSNEKLLKKLNKMLNKKGASGEKLLNDSLPSTMALKHVVESVTKMRDMHNQRDLSKIEIKTFRNSVVTSLDQAVTYENYLNR